MSISRAFDLFLAATMRSWFAVFWNTAFVFAYFMWNFMGPTPSRFDPYPYPFLCTMLTAFSYLQGPIIITMSWMNERAQKRQEEIARNQMQAMRDTQKYMLNMQEAVYAFILEKNPELAHTADHPEADGVV